ncbi:MAG: tubulin-like doman-containing protein [Caldilineaceae bacterium]
MNGNGIHLNGSTPIAEKATIYPTLVVGVGGMGTNTVRAVKRRLRKVWGGDTLPGMVQLLALDTEPLVNRLDQEPLYADEFAYMGKFDATRLVDNLDNHPEIARWWNYPSIPLGYIHNGAKQLRPIGRLSFFRNYVTFKRLLETKYAALDKIRDMEMAQNRGFPVMGNYQLVYVVGSLCGGTGSGMFMDVAHRVRALVRSNARVVGIFYLPDVIEEEITSDLQRRRIKANAYAALKELNYFQETQKFQELYPSEQRPLPDAPYAPFDFIFLVGRTNREGRSLARKADAENLAAHLIQLTAISHLSSEILGLEVNVVRERMADPNLPAGQVVGERKTKSGHFLVYSSFAASALVAPDESLTDFWQRAFVTDVIRRFAAGPSLQDPRQPMTPQERQQVMTIWQSLLAELRTRYLALNNDRLEDVAVEIEEGRGAWGAFRDLTERAFRQAIVDAGLRGAIALSELIGPSNAAAAAGITAPSASLPARQSACRRRGPRTLALGAGPGGRRGGARRSTGGRL